MARQSVRLEFGPLHYSVAASQDKKAADNEPKDILRGVSGVAAPGSLLAVLGPSGGGKTTLLNALAGRISDVRGPVLLNGARRSSEDVRALKRRTGYVMQDDLLLPNLTVRETLHFTAMLRMPGSHERKLAAVDATIEALRLRECEHTIIGMGGAPGSVRGISGGERKRVNIGNELLSDPSLLLLDEPTSGLDSATALMLVRVLKRLATAKSAGTAKDCAEAGGSARTIVATLHQPSSQVFAAVDTVMLLARGRTVYFGAAAGAVAHFTRLNFPCAPHFNPCDHMLEVVSAGESQAELLADAFDEHLGKRQIEVQHGGEAEGTDVEDVTIAVCSGAACGSNPEQVINRGMLSFALSTALSADASGARKGSTSAPYVEDKWASTWLQQWWLLMQRSAKNQRGETVGRLNLWNVGTITAVVSALWWRSAYAPHATDVNDVAGYLFFTSVFWAFWPMFNSLSTFPAERSVMFRERASGSYRLSAYFLAKSFSDVPLYIALPTLYTAVTYPAVGLSFSDGGVNFVRFLCVLLCNSLTAQSMGLMISCAVLDFKKSMVVCGCIMLTFMLCGGFYLDPRHIPTALAWLPKAGFTTFTFPALMMIVHSPSFGALAFACEAGDEHVTQ